MNKLFTKIATTIAGIAMAVGVGVAIGANQEARVAEATNYSYTLVTTGSASSFTSGYGNHKTATINERVWVGSFGQPNYLGSNNSTNYDLALLTNSNDLAVANGYDANITNETKGYVVFYCESGFSDIGKVVFTSTGANGSPKAYLLKKAAGGSWGLVTSLSQGSSSQGATVAGSSNTTLTYLFDPSAASTQFAVLFEKSGSGSYMRIANPTLAIYSAVEDVSKTITLESSTLTIGVGTSSSFSISHANLTNNISVAKTSGDGAVELSSNSISKDTSPASIIITGLTAGELELSFSSVGATTQTLAVTVEETTPYALIDDADNLTSGTQFIIVSGNYVLNAYGTGSNNARFYSGSPVFFDENSDARTLNYRLFTITGNSSAWTMQDNSGYYIGCDVTTSARINSNKTLANVDNSSWVISIDDQTSIATIQNTASGSSNRLYYNSGANRFSNYNNDSNLKIYGILAPGLIPSASAKTLTAGDSADTSITLAPKNLPEGTVTYEVSSSDSTKATGSVSIVSSTPTLSISPKAQGSATLTITVKVDGVAKATATVAVTVNSPSREFLGIVSSGETTDLNINQPFVYGGIVNAYYDNGGEEEIVDVTDDCTFTINDDEYELGDLLELDEDIYDVTITYPNESEDNTTTYEITVTPWSGVLTIGEEYLLVSSANKTAMSSYNASTYFDKVSYNAFPKISDTLIVVAGATYNSYAFKTSEVDGSDNPYYLSYSGSSNTLNRVAIAAGDPITAAASWTVSISDGNYVITNVDNTNRVIQYNKNSGQEKYSTYTGTQQPVQLVLVDEYARAGEFIETYMHTEIEIDDDPDLPVNKAMDCKNEGWYSAARAAYVTMKTNDEDAFDVFVAGDEKYTNYFVRLQAWALANTEEIDDDGEFKTPASRISLDTTNSGTNETITIVIISVTSLSALGAFFLFRKRRVK